MNKYGPTSPRLDKKQYWTSKKPTQYIIRMDIPFYIYVPGSS